ncbi:hypothetical protein CYMTET_14126 [Cymbomonas tetramitiformis]|uniref:AB hydrolase-1 domain-containing protein n=1 Tax=Cymbomonas tetramitiformis TaxID=36881 RepID=A0AAE0GH34_9CHLO|nr:hypothetical protein CYMTET_14126 [Cymbomonas tetramitiformis]
MRKTFQGASAFGTGKPAVDARNWQDFLISTFTAQELAEEVREFSFSPKNREQALSVAEAAEGIRRVLELGLGRVPVASTDDWSREQCVTMARRLFCDASEKLEEDVEPAGDLPLPNRQCLPPPLPFAVAMMLGAAVGRKVVNFLGLRSRWVTTPRGEFHVYHSVPAPWDPCQSARTPIVVLHGMCVPGSCMTTLGLLLKGDRPVVIPDMLGWDYGFSSARTMRGIVGRYQPSLEEHIQSVAELLNALFPGGRPFDLCGHSLGGFVAFRLTQQLPPGRVRNLVLLAPGGLCNYGLGHVINNVNAPYNSAVHFLRSGLPWPIAMVASWTTYRMFRSPQSISLMGDLYPAGLANYFCRRAPVHTRSLVIWGDDDFINKARSDEFIMECIPRGEGYWVNGGTHSIIVESVVTLYNLITPFLAASDESPSQPPPAFTRALLFLLASTNMPVTKMQSPSPPRQTVYISPAAFRLQRKGGKHLRPDSFNGINGDLRFGIVPKSLN